MQNTTLLPRSEALFAQAEMRAERTVGLLRILIAVALIVVFVVAVLRIAPDDQPMLSRQWMFAGGTMFAYLLLGVASFLVSARGAYRPWMAWLAVTGDCAFLLANVWLGLINTGLPANYVISLPPIWLAPVALSFGALRFNPALQGYLVGLLILGLMAIALFGASWDYELDAAPPNVLSLFFAVPPNVMRLAMLALAGLVLVVAAIRARALLTRAISETHRGINLTRYLPQQIADRLAEAGLDELRRGRRQNAAILFVDIRGFTPLSEAMPPEALSAFVTEFRRRITRAVDACDGTIDKFIGDAAMVVFGLVRPSENDAAAALRCANLILSEVAEWGKQRKQAGEDAVEVGIGVHWGEVFCGAIGDDTRLEYSVLGDSVNIAARLQEQTKQVGWPIVASRDILAAAGLSGDRKAWHALDKTALRGRRGLIDTYGSDGSPSRD